MNDNRCLFCGTIIPEGRQLCPLCEQREKFQKVEVKTILSMTEQKKKAVEEARRETAREILRDLYYEATSNITETIELIILQIEELAEKYGVDLGE